jgi:hypothetical protein
VFSGNLDVSSGLDVTGNITVSGTVDGVDIAALNTTVGNITTDVVSDTSPQLGGDLDFNGNNALLQGAGTNVNTNWDNDAWEKIVFDASYNQNAQGPNKIVLHNDSGWKAGFGMAADELGMYTGGDIVLYGNTTDSTASSKETLAKFKSDGAVELYHNNSKKFETTSAGVTVTGGLSTAGADISHINGQLRCQADTDERLRLAVPSNNADDWSYIGFYGRDGNRDAFVGTWSDGTPTIYSDASGGHFIKFHSASIEFNNHVLPNANNSLDLGSSGSRWRNVYTNDLHLSNEGSSNDVDNTWGDWTIQEGESDLFLKNNRSGKKYKFNLTEVS